MSEVSALQKNIRFKAFLIPLILIAFCMFNIESVTTGIKQGLELSFCTVIPSLFIFTVLSDITVSLLFEDEKIDFPPKIIAFLIGSLCGFPIGAIMCEKLCENNIITKRDAAKIVPFCNNASPAFVIGVIGVTLLNNKKIGVIIYFSQLLASLIPIALIKTKKLVIKTGERHSSLNDIFFSAIERSIYGVLKISALICIFSALVEIIECTPLAPLALLFELGNGVKYCMSLESFPITVASALCAFCCGFSGICVLLQIKSMLKTVEIKLYTLFLLKLLQGVFCSFFCLVFMYLFI